MENHKKEMQRLKSEQKCSEDFDWCPFFAADEQSRQE